MALLALGAALPRPAAGERHVRLFHSPEYVGAAYSFETTRKAGWIADSLATDPIAGLALEAPPVLSEEELKTIHAPAYLAAVRTGMPRSLAESQGFRWDPGLWRMAVAMGGGVVQAGLAALTDGVAGSLSLGLHHARRERGNGFCTFNTLALAAFAALEAGAGRVLILDLDAHCGGGTSSLIGGDPAIRLLDVSVHPFDRYVPTPGNTLDHVRRAADYLPTVERRLAELDGEGFGLVLYYAGMDPHQHCPIGGLAGIDGAILEAREHLVFGWARQRGFPIAFVPGGGYTGPLLNRAALVGLHRLTLTAAVG
jgi:acetoin utilization deacetylase AcuC-like enzyme